MSEQSEAGPSTPRSASRPASPSLDAPATTANGSRTMTTPQQTPEHKTKRRSWFGFGSSPAASSTPIKQASTLSPSASPGDQGMSRSSSGLLDLDFPLPPGSDRDKLPSEPATGEAVGFTTPVKGGNRAAEDGVDADAMQLQDLSSSHPRRTSVLSNKAKEEEDDSTPPPPPAWDEKPTPPRIPSVSYSHRRLSSESGPLHFPSPSKYRPLARPTLPVRSSSRNVSSSSGPLNTEKDPPPLPVDRPLPPVPPDPAASPSQPVDVIKELEGGSADVTTAPRASSTHLKDDGEKDIKLESTDVLPKPATPEIEEGRPKLALVASPVPAVPREIVITPSSPNRSDFPHETISHQLAVAASEDLTDAKSTVEFDDQSGERESADPGDGSPTKRRANIGLGLPPQLVRQPSTERLAPSVPVRIQPQPQAVSSPLPHSSPSPQSASPGPKLLFSEPQTPKQKGKQPTTATPGTQKAPATRRSRSASGFFGKRTPSSSRTSSRSSSREPPPPVPPLPIDQPDIGPSTPGRPAVEKDQEKTKTGGGMLEWLGVRKTLKKRKSEARLPEAAQAAARPSGGDVTPTRASVSTDRKEPIRASSDSTTRTTSEIAIPRGSKDTNRSQSRSSTKDQARSFPKTGGFFSRKASNRTIDLDDDLNPIQVPESSQRSSPSPYSSTEHLVIPSPSAPEHAFDSLALPINLDGHMARAWSSSPTTGAEEFLTSPGTSAHWGPGVRPWMNGEPRQRRSPRSAASSPLGSLTDQSLLSTVMDAAKEPEDLPPAESVKLEKRENRPRSHSDAPRPTSVAPSPVTGSFTPPIGASTPSSQHLTLPTGSPRPKLGARSNSGNSAVIGRMRAAFSNKSMNRERSRTMQPTLGDRSNAGVDEFGSMHPSGAALGSADMLKDDSQRSLLGLNGSDRQIFTPGTSPRNSIAASTISTGPPSAFVPSSPEPGSRMSRLRTRMRASTVSSAQTSTSLFPPTSPDLFPLAATPPRRRPSVIQRLSNSRFATIGSPKSGTSLFPLPPRSSGSTSSNPGLDGLWGESPPSLLSPSMSPRPSMGSITTAMNDTAMKAVAARVEGETVDAWLERVTGQVGRSEISNLLAASGDEFHAEALRKYMSRFDFTHQALDIALRRLLMHISLPRETQQIDRIIEAFAQRYEQCEPGLFLHKDNTYILAFSMMMLHTDVFNRHNKNKMTKADYVRNTRMQGVAPAVLEAFFDNITYTPFVFIEDDQELHAGRPGDLTGSAASSGGTSTTPITPLGSKSVKIDVYRLIKHNALETVQTSVYAQISPESPISCLGTRVIMDLESLHSAFTSRAISLAIPTNRPRATSAVLSASARGSVKATESILRAAKIGVLARQDDSKDANKKQKKWKEWTAIVTSSQIVFLKDPTIATALNAKTGSTVSLPSKADEMISVRDVVAFHDRASTTPFSFTLVVQLGVRMGFRAASELEMNEWIHVINYASAFRSAGIRLRASGLAKDEAVLAGAAAAASHQRDVQIRKSQEDENQPKHSVGRSTKDEPAEPVQTSEREVSGGTEPETEAVQLDKVFVTVKAELAAGRGGAERIDSSLPEKRASSSSEVKRAVSTRGDHVKKHLKSLEEQRRVAEIALNESLRLARNLAILAPFQRVTRDKILATLPNLASRLRQEQLQVARLGIWIDILRRDQAAEDREFASLRHVALQAAAKSLRDPGGVQSAVDDARRGARAIPIPTFSLSSNDDSDREPAPARSNDRELQWPSSAPMETTRSATEYFAASPDNVTPAAEVDDPFSSSAPVLSQMSKRPTTSWRTESPRPASPAVALPDEEQVREEKTETPALPKMNTSGVGALEQAEEPASDDQGLEEEDPEKGEDTKEGLVTATVGEVEKDGADQKA